MPALRTLLLVVVTLAVTPGLLELLDNGVHFVMDGRTDHQEDGESCPEHGCTATSHHCGCCSSLAFAHAPTSQRLPSAAAIRRPRLLDQSRRGPRGITTQLRRPPIA